MFTFNLGGEAKREEASYIEKNILAVRGFSICLMERNIRFLGVRCRRGAKKVGKPNQPNWWSNHLLCQKHFANSFSQTSILLLLLQQCWFGTIFTFHSLNEKVWVRFWALGDLFSEGRNVNVKASVSLYVSSTFWAIGHRFDGDLICMRKALNCSLHTHTHGNGHQLLDFQDLYALSRNYWNLHTSDTNPSISSKERLGNDLGDPQNSWVRITTRA